jgi:hypothetical protein
MPTSTRRPSRPKSLRREPPAAARGFFEETEEHEMPGHEERPGADPDFEN